MADIVIEDLCAIGRRSTGFCELDVGLVILVEVKGRHVEYSSVAAIRTLTGIPEKAVDGKV